MTLHPLADTAFHYILGSMSDEDVEKSLPLAESKTTAIIKGGIRTLAQLVPVAGGAISQAWSEYETFTQNRRVDEFFTRLGSRLSIVESQIGDLSARIRQLGDAAELLEEIVEGVKRETQTDKRQSYVNTFIYFVKDPGKTNRDERRSIIADLDVLTSQDFGYLSKFTAGNWRGDMITDTGIYGFSPTGEGHEADKEWERILGPAIHSLAKLEARGLIVRTTINASFSMSGPGDAWYNQFRRKAWQLTPMGAKLLEAIRS